MSLARATLSLARSVPNQGFALALSTGLRVVATKSEVLAERSGPSRRRPGAETPAQPPIASDDAADISPRRTARREAPREGLLPHSPDMGNHHPVLSQWHAP